MPWAGARCRAGSLGGELGVVGRPDGPAQEVRLDCLDALDRLERVGHLGVVSPPVATSATARPSRGCPRRRPRPTRRPWRPRRARRKRDEQRVVVGLGLGRGSPSAAALDGGAACAAATLLGPGQELLGRRGRLELRRFADGQRVVARRVGVGRVERCELIGQRLGQLLDLVDALLLGVRPVPGEHHRRGHRHRRSDPRPRGVAASTPAEPSCPSPLAAGPAGRPVRSDATLALRSRPQGTSTRAATEPGHGSPRPDASGRVRALRVGPHHAAHVGGQVVLGEQLGHQLAPAGTPTLRTSPGRPREAATTVPQRAAPGREPSPGPTSTTTCSRARRHGWYLDRMSA